MRFRPLLLSLALFMGFAGQGASAATLTAEEAKNHVGENATVCGLVASTRYASESRGSPTFVNLEKPYPNQIFTILIWGEDLSKFSPKPTTWDGKRVCATGLITSYRGLPEIVAKSPDQIKMEEPKQK
jgi:DNA/RNA endonuclease YhcR with UshA esterase domain